MNYGGHKRRITKDEREEILRVYLENPDKGSQLAMSKGLSQIYAYKLAHALELKAPGGRLTPSQRLVLAHMENCGAQTAVAHSLDEALVTLEFWGILKRDANKETA